MLIPNSLRCILYISIHADIAHTTSNTPTMNIEQFMPVSSISQPFNSDKGHIIPASNG